MSCKFMPRDTALKHIKANFTHMKFATKKDERSNVLGTFMALVNLVVEPELNHQTPYDYRLEWLTPVNDVSESTLLLFFTGNEYKSGQVYSKILKEI
jgi:hypothetical protein